ncbi:MAG: tetratricopeptide repeat protein, partial [Alphaproteobacteria bacterium]
MTMGMSQRFGMALLAGAVALGLAGTAAASVAEGRAALDRSDYRAAYNAFSNAAARGEIEGQYQLGLLHMLGRGGMERDYPRAAQWFGRAAEGGHARAMYMLGNLYATGNGVALDYDRARRLILSAEPGLDSATRLS